MVFGKHLDEGESGLEPEKLIVAVDMRAAAVNTSDGRVTGEEKRQGGV